MDADGEIIRDGGRAEIRFERRLARPVEQVWNALVTPERISDWFHADAIVEPRVGGRFVLDFRHDPSVMQGVITRWEPPTLLEFTWPEAAAEGPSRVRWELTSDGDGCRLRLIHVVESGANLTDFASGWHWHLDALEQALEGVGTAWDDRWAALKADYVARYGPV